MRIVGRAGQGRAVGGSGVGVRRGAGDQMLEHRAVREP
jgi:hypothetical protein